MLYLLIELFLFYPPLPFIHLWPQVQMRWRKFLLLSLQGEGTDIVVTGQLSTLNIAVAAAIVATNIAAALFFHTHIK